MEPNNFNKLCRLFFTLIILLLSVHSTFGQATKKLHISYQLDSVKISTGYNYKVEVSIQDGTGPFTYFLCTREPWLGGTILEQHNDISQSTYTFSVAYSPLHLVIMAKGSGKDEYNWETLSTSQQ